jgi:hypothetical protein
MFVAIKLLLAKTFTDLASNIWQPWEFVLNKSAEYSVSFIDDFISSMHRVNSVCAHFGFANCARTCPMRIFEKIGQIGPIFDILQFDFETHAPVLVTVDAVVLFNPSKGC